MAVTSFQSGICTPVARPSRVGPPARQHAWGRSDDPIPDMGMCAEDG